MGCTGNDRVPILLPRVKGWVVTTSLPGAHLDHACRLAHLYQPAVTFIPHEGVTELHMPPESTVPACQRCATDVVLNIEEVIW